MSGEKKSKRRYDYVAELDCHPSYREGPVTARIKRILRKLVREAVMDAFRAWPGFDKREVAADRIAKELVP